MSPAVEPVSGSPLAERARELDRAHRATLPPAWPLVLSMRYLGRALGRLGAGTSAVRATSVPRPPAGTVSVTFVGHATVMITSPAIRVVADPLLENTLYGVRRAKAAAIAAADLADTGLVLITHGHRDHLSRASLSRLPTTATFVVPPGCARLLRGLGFEDVVELAPGASLARADVEVVAVPVRHSGARGLGGYVRRGACGYVVRAGAREGGAGPAAIAAGAPAATDVAATRDACVYVAGDTGYFSGFVEIGRRFNPDVALLPIAGYLPAGFRDEHLSPLDAAYAFEDLGARILIPTSYGSFPLSYERLDEPLAWLRRIARERGLDRGDGARRVAVLDHGETVHLRVRA